METEQTGLLEKMTQGALGKQCHSSDRSSLMMWGRGTQPMEERDGTERHERGRCRRVEQTHHAQPRRPRRKRRNPEALEEPRDKTCLPLEGVLHGCSV